ncbi:uncharacterized protein isoform X1 [Leptinotarsa decemlineata]|uniref:uncharacterized protein isoform X1 n=1 Tax=Leptinotarsa decemlineata TaxID=7539 RepID=UPI003D30AC8A
MNAIKSLLVLVFVMITIPNFIHCFYSIVPCYDDEECEHLENATCIDYICNCNGTNLCTEKSITVVTRIGANCSRNSDCNIEFSRCGNNVCACKELYVASPDQKRCLEVSSGLGASCEDSVQCYDRVPHSGCQNNKCVCQQQMHKYQGLCYRNVELGQNCGSDAECSATHFSKCINSTCSCIDGFVASTRGSRCLPVVDGEHAPCVDNVQCTATMGESSECADAFCQCKDLYQVKNSTKKCVRDMVLGDICVNHSDCHGPNPGLSRLECVLGVCKCKPFFQEIKGYCISEASRNQSTSILMKIGLCLFTIFFLWNH